MHNLLIAKIAGPDEHPAVVRYLPKVYVDEFFDTGRIRLSSFAEFARHPDERRDGTEGSAVVEVLNPPSPQFPDGSTEFWVMRVGVNEYILSARREDASGPRPSWMGGHGIRIVQPVGFALAIAAAMPNPSVVMLGPCTYAARRVVERSNVGEFDISAAKEGRMTLNDLAARGLGLAGQEPLLLKHSSYAHEGEFRFIWRAEGSVDAPLDVVCPDAVQCCEPYTASDE